MELSVWVGDEVSALEEERGWVWAKDDAGQMGWVPASKLEQLAPALSG